MKLKNTQLHSSSTLKGTRYSPDAQREEACAESSFLDKLLCTNQSTEVLLIQQ